MLILFKMLGWGGGLPLLNLKFTLLKQFVNFDEEKSADVHICMEFWCDGSWSMIILYLMHSVIHYVNEGACLLFLLNMYMY